MKLASIAAVFVLWGCLGSARLMAQPGDPIPAKQASVDGNTAGTEPYGNNVAFAIILIGGLATFGRKVAADTLIRAGHGGRGATVLRFPSRTLHGGPDEAPASRVLYFRRPLIRVK
jgi:hypothetical protein